MVEPSRQLYLHKLRMGQERELAEFALKVTERRRAELEFNSVWRKKIDAALQYHLQIEASRPPAQIITTKARFFCTDDTGERITISPALQQLIVEKYAADWHVKCEPSFDDHKFASFDGYRTRPAYHYFDFVRAQNGVRGFLQRAALTVGLDKL